MALCLEMVEQENNLMSKINIELNLSSLSAEIVAADLANTVYGVAFDGNDVPSLVRKGKGTHGIRLTENAYVQTFEFDVADPNFEAKVNAELALKFKRINRDGVGFPHGFAEAHKLYSESIKTRDVSLVKIAAKAKTLSGKLLEEFNAKAEEFKKGLVVHHIPDELKVWQPDEVQRFKDGVINRLATEMIKKQIGKPNVDKVVQSTVSKLADEQLQKIAKLRGEKVRAERAEQLEDIENFFADLAK